MLRNYKKLVCLIIVREVADHAHCAAVKTFLLFHFHKVVQVRYLGEMNMFFHVCEKMFFLLTTVQRL